MWKIEKKEVKGEKAEKRLGKRREERTRRREGKGKERRQESRT